MAVGGDQWEPQTTVVERPRLTPGETDSSGAVLILDGGRPVAWSANLTDVLPGALGEFPPSMDALLPPEVAQTIALAAERGPRWPVRVLVPANWPAELEVRVHVSDTGRTVVDLEPLPRAAMEEENRLRIARAMCRAPDMVGPPFETRLQRLAELLARESGFERVQIRRFEPEGALSIVHDEHAGTFEDRSGERLEDLSRVARTRGSLVGAGAVWLGRAEPGTSPLVTVEPVDVQIDLRRSRLRASSACLPPEPVDMELRTFGMVGIGPAAHPRGVIMLMDRRSRPIHPGLRTLLPAVAEQVERVWREAEAGPDQVELLAQLGRGFAHDINNVLMALSTAVGLVADDERLDAEDRALLHGACDAAQRGMLMVSSLQAFARDEHPATEAFDLGDELGSLLPLLQGALRRGMRLRLERVSEPMRVRANRGLLQSAILNLVVNADRASPARAEILLRAGRARDGTASPQVRLEVIDHGEGMSPEVLARATQAFFSTRTGSGGSGLGLAMVAGFAETSGGTLAIESEAGSGTRVTLDLPLLDPGPGP